MSHSFVGHSCLFYSSLFCFQSMWQNKIIPHDVGSSVSQFTWHEFHERNSQSKWNRVNSIDRSCRRHEMSEEEQNSRQNLVVVAMFWLWKCDKTKEFSLVKCRRNNGRVPWGDSSHVTVCKTLGHHRSIPFFDNCTKSTKTNRLKPIDTILALPFLDGEKRRIVSLTCSEVVKQ